MSLFGKTDSGAARPKFLDVGQIKKINVTNGGTGYTNGAAVAVTIAAPDGDGVQATATAVVSGGIVRSINLVNPGAGYYTDADVSLPAVSMSGGTGLTVGVVLAPIQYDYKKIVFVDRDEAQLETNKKQGVNTPGWWYFDGWNTENSGDKWRAECLVAMSSSVTAISAGDASDDSAEGIYDFDIVFTAQPEDVEVEEGGEVELSVTVAPDTGISYIWEFQVEDNWETIDDGEIYDGVNTNVLTITAEDDTVAGQYRVVVSSTTNGAAAEVASEVAVVTVTPAEV